MITSFSSFVRRAFDFLVERHGFKVIQEQRALVTYQSSMCEISLFYDDQRSFEVGLGIAGCQLTDNPPFSFDEILRAQNVPESEWPMGYSARTVEDASELLDKIAVLISRYAVELVEGHQPAWERLIEQRKSDCIRYTKETNHRLAKAKANDAWAVRDYIKVIEALEGVDVAWLGKADLAKLEYARRAVAAR